MQQEVKAVAGWAHIGLLGVFIDRQQGLILSIGRSSWQRTASQVDAGFRACGIKKLIAGGGCSI